MMNRSWRTGAAALLLVAVVSMAAPVPAHASDVGFAERLSGRLEILFHDGLETMTSLFDVVGDFVSRSTATICGDG